jgi:hypothetical protein
MSVEIRSNRVKEFCHRYGEYERDPIFDAVLFNGKQIGWRPTDKNDPHHRTLHPLSGVPQQVAELAVKQSSELDKSLRAPRPVEIIEEDE